MSRGAKKAKEWRRPAFGHMHTRYPSLKTQRELLLAPPREGLGDFRPPMTLMPGYHGPWNLPGSGRSDQYPAQYIPRRNGVPLGVPYTYRRGDWQARVRRVGLDLSQIALADEAIDQADNEEHAAANRVGYQRRVEIIAAGGTLTPRGRQVDHPSERAYQYGCRQPDCLAAHAAHARDKRKAKALKEGRVYRPRKRRIAPVEVTAPAKGTRGRKRLPVEHPSERAYQRGCRQPDCLAAHAQYSYTRRVAKAAAEGRRYRPLPSNRKYRLDEVHPLDEAALAQVIPPLEMPAVKAAPAVTYRPRVKRPAPPAPVKRSTGLIEGLELLVLTGDREWVARDAAGHAYRVTRLR